MARSNVDTYQLRALLFCRECRVAEAGVTLVDVHDTRLSASLPASFPELWLYVCFEAPRPGPVHLELRVTLPSQQEVTVASSAVTVGEGCVVISPLDLSQFEFGAPGRYSFGLRADGVSIGSSTLTIELLLNPPHRSTN